MYEIMVYEEALYVPHFEEFASCVVELYRGVGPCVL